ncbi:DUF3349 domain-containing protein [Williamsia sterculiae]|uniref:DUF3349 domain-containing protein n=1 Tax=Williamsia sterculiae TaxID=1344003 RepID=A0A1N7CYW9_9NOCA|nr:DUF3349 domain-containing protein [Williamsia sterculiae]SIR68769.1 Protein of unknown function [Williamsia sterculiae]
MADHNVPAAGNGNGTNKFEAILNWLRAGYPDGVPPKDYFPLLALLKRSLSPDQITDVILNLFMANGTDQPVTAEQIRKAISEVIEDEPEQSDINQVAARLAAVGWPLAVETP